jgi:tryptophan-rich hypothetical protein
MLMGGSCISAVGSALAAAAAGALTALPMAKKKNLRGVRNALWERLDGGSGPSRPRPCRLCAGSGAIPCEPCRGLGMLPAGGFATKNSIKLSSIVGSQWTAVEAIQGRWRHFRVIGRKGKAAKDAVLTLTGTCGPAKSRLVVNVPVTDLRRRDLWAGGWTTMQDLRLASLSGGAPGPRCTACSGEKTIDCPRCDGIGSVGLSGW